jgi:hypothetical protein
MRRSLSLKREAVTDLTPGDLAQVAGGTFHTLECQGLTARTCPTVSPEWCHTLLAPECNTTTR